MTKEAAQTAFGPTILVAIEQYFPRKQRCLEDDLAYRILPFSSRAVIWVMRLTWLRRWFIRVIEKNYPGFWGSLMCRGRYIDEKLIESSNQMDAVVNLGAGFDTRAYRLSTLADKPVWEVDQLDNIHAKQSRLRKLFGTIPSHVQLAAIDFDREDLSAVLETYGYSMHKRTFFILEAVTQYLTEQGIKHIFDFLAQAAHGSRLVLTYVRKEFLDGRSLDDWEKFYQKFVKDKKVFIFGMEPAAWPAFLKQYEWQIIEDVGYDEMIENYIQPTGRVLASTPIERMIYAEKL